MKTLPTPLVDMALLQHERWGTLVVGLQQGDLSADLDYVDEASLSLPGNSIITGENGVAANLVLPTLGHAAVYRSGKGTSLGATSNIVINTSRPIVTTVR